MDDDKLNIDDLDLFEGQEETYDMVSFIEDNGTETDFFVMDGMEIEGVRYLLLVKAEDIEDDEPEAFIFKEVAADDDECTYEPVEDETEFNKVYIMFQNEDADYELTL